MEEGRTTWKNKQREPEKEKEVDEWNVQPPGIMQIGWEVLEPRTTIKKVRKPIKITCWFGNEDQSSSSSDDNTEDWTEIDKVKKSREKKKKQVQKKKRKTARNSTQSQRDDWNWTLRPGNNGSFCQPE